MNYYLIKTEKKDKEVKKLRVNYEYRIYKKLHRKKFGSGLPQIYDYLETPSFNLMVMKLMGSSLEDIFITLGKKFKYETVFFNFMCSHIIKCM